MDYDMIIASSQDMDSEGGVDLDKIYPVTVEEKRRNVLCERLLELIAESVQTFKPSKSLGSLSTIRDPTEPPVEIDIVISGGGLKGYFMAGCSHILLSELAKQNVKIARIAGASAGAWCGLFMLCNLGTEMWVETYYKCRERPGMTMHEAYTELWPWMQNHMPENAWEICNGRLFVSVTEVTLFGLKNHMISEYTSNQDVFEACMASSTVPYISLPHMMRRYKDMWVVDGGATNNTPVFPDHIRRQLVFRLGDVLYPLRFWINPNGELTLAVVCSLWRSLRPAVLDFFLCLLFRVWECHNACYGQPFNVLTDPGISFHRYVHRGSGGARRHSNVPVPAGRGERLVRVAEPQRLHR
jgi:hypothetical protein